MCTFHGYIQKRFKRLFDFVIYKNRNCVLKFCIRHIRVSNRSNNFQYVEAMYITKKPAISQTYSGF